MFAFSTPWGEEENQGNKRGINYLLFETTSNQIPFYLSVMLRVGILEIPQSIQRRTTSRGKCFAWMKHGITGRGGGSNLSSGRFIWPWKSWQQIVKWNRFIVSWLMLWRSAMFWPECLSAALICQSYSIWQQLMGQHAVSVRFCFLDNFMCSGNDYAWSKWLKAQVCKACGATAVYHLPNSVFSVHAIVTQKVKKLTSDIKTTSPACDLGLSEQPLLTNLIWHFECLGLFCEWEFNHHIINGFGVGPVIHDTVLYSFARNLRAEMRRL